MSNTINLTYTSSDFTLEPGDLFKLHRQQGVFRFKQHVVYEDGSEAIECYGGRARGDSQWFRARAFHPEMIKGPLPEREKGAWHALLNAAQIPPPVRRGSR